MNQCASNTTKRRKILRTNKRPNLMEGTITGRVNRERRLTRTTMEIFRRRTIFTSSIPRLTGNKKRQMMRVAIHLIQRATFSVQSQLESQKLKVTSNINNNNLAKQIAAKINTLKIINTKVNTVLTPIRTISTANHPRNNRRSSSIGILGTIRTSTKPTIIGLTSKRIDTRLRRTLNDEPNVLLSLVITSRRRNLPSMQKTVGTLKKTSVRVGEQLFRITTSKCSKSRISTSLDKMHLPGRIMSSQMPKGNSIVKLMNQ